MEQQEAMTVPEYRTRVLNERSELHDKIDKLAAFLKTPTYNGLDDEDRALLSQQLRAMRNYIDILDERISRF